MMPRQRQRAFWVFALPILLIFLILVVIPFFINIYLSLTNWNGYSKTMTFVGLKNYIKMFGDKIVRKAFFNNVKLFVIGMLFTMGIALFFAIVITRYSLQERKFYRIVFFFPNMLSIVIVSCVWTFIFNPTFGLLNGLLRILGLNSWTHAWLGEKSTVLGALSVPWIWMSMGYYMVLFIAAIENIPKTLFEAAEIDGASLSAQTIHIIIPLVWETIRICLVYFVVNAFSGTFTLVNITTDGDPARASELLTTYMYKNAFANGYGKFGYAATIGILVFVILITLSALFLRLTRRDTIEY